MPAYHVERAIEITKPHAEVMRIVHDFQRWPAWSPWNYLEPADIEIDVWGEAGKTGHGYSWRGNATGAGKMQIDAASDDTLAMTLTFLKPFKSTAKVDFRVEALGESKTRVTWSMDGKLPFFLFFMVEGMKAFIGSDFQRGLMLLKDVAEHGSARAHSTVGDVVSKAPLHYLAMRKAGPVAELPKLMEDALPKLHDFIQAHDALEIAGPPMSVVHHFDMKNQQTDVSVAIPVSAASFEAVRTGRVTLPTSMQAGELPACRALEVEHVGAYDHLAGAWATAQTHLRHRKLKAHKKQAPFEIYESDPAEVDERDRVTRVYLPVR